MMKKWGCSGDGKMTSILERRGHRNRESGLKAFELVKADKSPKSKSAGA